MRPLAVLIALCSFGCASDPYEPLVCDPQRAGESAFGYRSEGALGSVIPALLVIDGDCRFWALNRDEARGRHSEARTGVLTVAELDAINADLLTGPWRSVDGVRFQRRPLVSDAGTTTLWRDDVVGGCSGWCRDAGNLGVLESAALTWLDALYERGEPLTGPVIVRGARSRSWSGEGGVEWTGATPLAPSFPPDDAMTRSFGYLRVEDLRDAALLRSIRAATARDEITSIRDRGVSLDVFIHDPLPASVLPPGER
jgi:hypothetical protein